MPYQTHLKNAKANLSERSIQIENISINDDKGSVLDLFSSRSYQKLIYKWKISIQIKQSTLSDKDLKTINYAVKRAHEVIARRNGSMLDANGFNTAAAIEF